MRTNTLTTMTLALAFAACGAEQASREETDDANARVDRALSATQQARDAAHLMGLVPTMPCGAAEYGWLRDLIPELKLKVGCADLSLTNEAQVSTLAIDFPDACTVRGKALQGEAAFRYVDQDGIALELDLTGLNVDGQPIPARAGYEVCKDEDHYFASAAGHVDGREPADFTVDLSLKKRDGAALIGGPTLTFDLDEQLTIDGHVERVTATDLVYTVGDELPRDGHLEIATWDGHFIEARFGGGNLPQLSIDGKAGR